MFISRVALHQSATRSPSPFVKTLCTRDHSYLEKRSRIDLSLYLVTHRSCVVSDEIFIAKILNAIKGGVSCVQIRDRDEDLEALIRTAHKLKSLLSDFHIPLIINDHVDIALEVNADGVHLGQKDLPYHVARNILGQNAIIGLSVDHWDDVIRAEELDVDYLGVSQLFGSQMTKLDYEQPWGLEGLKKIRAFSRHRLIPIGGINASNAASVCKILQVGPQADGIAMVGQLWRANNPYVVAQRVRSIIERAGFEKGADYA